MERLGKWLGKKKPERSSRVTRSAAAPSDTRTSYNEDIIPVEMLDVLPAKAMAFPCDDFMENSGIKQEFYSLCENAGLTRLVTIRVPQYETLTAVFVNSFRFYSDNDTVVFRLYDRLLTMPMSKFCEGLGLPGLVEKKKRKNIPTVEINTLLDSFCNTEVRKSNRQKISNIMFPHLRYFAYYIARGVLARDNTSNTYTSDTAIMENALSGQHEHHVGTLIARLLATNSTKGDVFGGVYATLLLQSLQGEPRPDDAIFPFVSLDLAAMKRHFFVTKASDHYALDYILRFKDGVTRNVRLPAPLVFYFSRRNGYRFSVAEFDEITGRYQYHYPTDGVEPDEGERVVYPPAQEEHKVYSPVQEETVTPWGEGSSSGWGSGPSSSVLENPRTSVYAPDFPYDPWTHQYYPRAGGSSGPQ